jgi:hypothetical protein
MPADDFAADMRTRLADRLLLLLKRVETPEWIWFEENLAYDNARFCEALISVGSATGTSTYITAGLRSLGWLTGRQKSPTGLFRPVGTESFHHVRTAGTDFDQQPVEAAATIAACLAAQRLTEDPRWTSEAHCAFAWFFGGNDLWQPVVDIETGSCRDGLHPDRRNENRGGESVLSYLLGLSDIRHSEQAIASQRPSSSSVPTPTVMPSLVSSSRGRFAASNFS